MALCVRPGAPWLRCSSPWGSRCVRLNLHTRKTNNPFPTPPPARARPPLPLGFGLGAWAAGQLAAPPHSRGGLENVNSLRQDPNPHPSPRYAAPPPLPGGALITDAIPYGHAAPTTHSPPLPPLAPVRPRPRLRFGRGRPDGSLPPPTPGGGLKLLQASHSLTFIVCPTQTSDDFLPFRSLPSSPCLATASAW